MTKTKTFKLGKTSLKRLEGVHPDLKEVVMLAIKLSKVDFFVVEGVRSDERQHQVFEEGNSELDGIKHKSKHQIQRDGFGHAVDIAPYVDGKAVWALEGNEDLWLEIGRAMLRAAFKLKVNLIWGLAFNIGRGHDLPHFQLSDFDKEIRCR